MTDAEKLEKLRQLLDELESTQCNPGADAEMVISYYLDKMREVINDD